MKTAQIKLPLALVKKVEAKLNERGIEIERYIALHLRVMLRNKNTLRLEDVMPFGKFSGELVEDVVRSEPQYISWLIGQNGKTNFDPEVLQLLEQMLEVD